MKVLSLLIVMILMGMTLWKRGSGPLSLLGEPPPTLSHLLLFGDHHNVTMVSHHQFILLDLQVPQDALLILHYLWRCCLFHIWVFQPKPGADVPVHLCQPLGYGGSCTCILHPAVMCWTVSVASVPSIHLGSCLVWWTPACIYRVPLEGFLNINHTYYTFFKSIQLLRETHFLCNQFVPGPVTLKNRHWASQLMKI